MIPPPRPTRRDRALGLLARPVVPLASVAILVVVLLAADVARLGSQAEATDADLASASAGRTLALRTLATGMTVDLPLEQYVARVLSGEGEPNAPDGASQALAIAIRTYAVFNAGRHRAEGFDLCDSTHCQVPRAASPASRRAVRATAGRILTYNGAPAEIFYSASCGGRSESADQVWPSAVLPYLRSVEDDVHADDLPWRLDMTLSAVQQALAREGYAGSQLRNVEVERRSPSGRVTLLRLTGLRPNAITGEQFRTLMGARQFRSTAFEVERRGTSLQFTGKGFGHGVGLCVIGAGRRARRGETVEAILAKYYPGLAISPLAEPPSSRGPGAGAREPAPSSATESSGSRVADAGAPAASAVVAPRPPAARSGLVTARVASGAPAAAPSDAGPATTLADLERMATTALATLSKTLGTVTRPVTVTQHETLEGFRAATGRPWWTNAAVSAAAIDLAPATLLEQRGGLEATLRTALAELLVLPVLSDRSAWVRLGAARYFARSVPMAAPPNRVQCPTDTELLLAVSAVAQREAEARAEACFARELARVRDWRTVR